MRIDDSSVGMDVPVNIPSTHIPLAEQIPVASASGGVTVLNYGGRSRIAQRAGARCYAAMLCSMFFGVQLVTHSVDLIFIQRSHAFDITQTRFIGGILSVAIALGLTALPIHGGIRARLAEGRSACLHFASLGLVVAFAWWALMFFLHSLLIRCGMD